MSEPPVENPSIIKRTLGNLFGIGRGKTQNQPPPISQETGIKSPPWIEKQRGPLESGIAHVGLQQSKEGPSTPGSIAPSSQGTGESPFTSAAREGNLPPKVMSPSGEEAERLAQRKKDRKTRAEILESSGKIGASLPLKPQTNKG